MTMKSSAAISTPGPITSNELSPALEKLRKSPGPSARYRPADLIGMNSIAAYCIAHLFDAFVLKNLKTNLGQDFFKLFGTAFEPLVHGAAALLVLWLLLFWMYRRKIFLRI